MAFKLNNAPFRKPKGQNHNGEDHTNASHKADAKAVRKAKGTEDQEVGNLLNVLNEAGSGGTIDNYTEYAEGRAERKYYEDAVRKRDPDTSTYRGDHNTNYTNSEGGRYISQMDAAVDFEKGQDKQAAEEKAKGNWYDESRSTSVEGREMAQADAVNEMVKREAMDRTEKNVEGDAAQARIDAATAKDAEADKVANMSRKELKEYKRAQAAAANSAMPKSGFKMQRKGYKY